MYEVAAIADGACDKTVEFASMHIYRAVQEPYKTRLAAEAVSPGSRTLHAATRTVLP